MKKTILAIALGLTTVSAYADVDYQKVFDTKGDPQTIIKKVSAAMGPKYSKEVNGDQLIIRGGYACMIGFSFLPVPLEATVNIIVEAKQDRYRVSFVDTVLHPSRGSEGNPVARMLPDNTLTNSTASTQESCKKSLAEFAEEINGKMSNTALADNNW